MKSGLIIFSSALFPFMYKSTQLGQGESKHSVVQWLKISVLIFPPGNSWLACCWPAVFPGSSRPTSMRWCKEKVSGSGECWISPFGEHTTFQSTRVLSSHLTTWSWWHWSIWQNLISVVVLGRRCDHHYCGKCINTLLRLLPYFQSLLMVSHSHVLISLVVFQERRNKRPDLIKELQQSLKDF